MEIINTWQFSIIAYYVFTVIYFQCYKLAVKDTQKDGASSAIFQLIAGSTLIMLLAPLFPLKYSTDMWVYALLFMAIIFYGVADRLNATVRKHLDVSVYTIVAQLSSVFIITLGFLFLGEEVSRNQIFGMALILAANVLLKFNKKKLSLNNYLWLAVLSALMFSVAQTTDIGIFREFNIPLYVGTTLTVPAILTMAIEKTTIQEVKSEFARNTKWYLVTGIAWAFLIFFTFRAYEFGEVATIVPLQSVTVILNVLIAYIVFNEKDNRLKKVLAAVLVMAGVYLTVS